MINRLHFQLQILSLQMFHSYGSKVDSIFIYFAAVIFAIIINMNTFQITQQIEKVFPDIEGQLCSKHSALLSSISKYFSKAYPLHTPTHFIVAKQPLILIKGKQLQLEMAMEQGIILMVSPADENQKINLWLQSEEQIVIQNSGKVINAEIQPEFTVLASKAINLAAQDLSLSKTKGGFIYVYLPQISEATSNATKNTLLIALFMAGITINDLIEEYSTQDLISKLKTLQEFRNNEIVENYFKFYRNRELTISGELKRNLKVDKKFKFLFMSLAFLDQQLPKIEQENAQFDSLIFKLGQNELQLIQFISKISSLQSQITISNQILSFVETIKTEMKIKASFYAQNYCVFFVQTFRYNEIINKISKMIHSKLQKPNSEELYNKKQALSSRQIMQSLLFSSMPSTGVSVIDPRNAMWF